jgi:hypothetical protein
VEAHLLGTVDLVGAKGDATITVFDDDELAIKDGFGVRDAQTSREIHHGDGLPSHEYVGRAVSRGRVRRELEQDGPYAIDREGHFDAARIDEQYEDVLVGAPLEGRVEDAVDGPQEVVPGDRLWKEPGRPGANARVPTRLFGRDDEDGDGSEPRIRPHDLEELVSIHVGHREVEDDDVGG